MNKKLIKIAISAVVVLGCMVACGYGYMYNHGLSGKYTNTEAKEEQIKVACVGDSITYGHGVEDWETNNYPAQLQEMLGEEYHVMNFGSSGSCVNPNGDQPYTDRAVYQESLDYEADVIVFMLGTNDSKPENWTDIDTFIEDYKELLGTYLDRENPPQQVYIGLCAECYYTEDADIDTGIAGFDIQPAITDEIVEQLKEEYQSSSEISVIDIHSLTEAHPEWFETDGIHPNADGARAIAETVADAIQKSK